MATAANLSTSAGVERWTQALQVNEGADGGLALQTWGAASLQTVMESGLGCALKLYGFTGTDRDQQRGRGWGRAAPFG